MRFLDSVIGFALLFSICWSKAEEASLGYDVVNILQMSDHIQCTKRSAWPGIRSDVEQINSFWRSGDFGALKPRIESMKTICDSNSNEGSFLECSDHLRFCRGKNLFFNLGNLNAATSSRYRSDIIQEDQVVGCCDFLDTKVLSERMGETGYLQSWAMELKNFKSISSLNEKEHCDFVFEKPTLVIKLDASVNMYHHFCDFVNLFASQFLNNSYFGQDIDVLWWDTYSGGYIDPLFGSVWQAFSSKKPMELIKFGGKKICFRDVTFSLLARQIFGFYYNMPLVDGCQGSGFFHLFSHHLLNRLNIKQSGPLLEKVRVTILQRQTKFRKILNIEEVVIQNFERCFI